MNEIDEDASAAVIVRRWRELLEGVYAALDAADDEQVLSLLDERWRLIPKLEVAAPEIEPAIKEEILKAEDDLRETLASHHDYVGEKLSGLGRMSLAMRKYKS